MKTLLLLEIPHILVTVLVAALVCTSLSSSAEENIKRPFTIKDSIEISYIVGPEEEDPAPIYSPDTRYFLLVTQRGVLPSNTLEGTIWLFDRQSVRDYSAGKSAGNPPPRKLVTLSSTSNTAVVNDVRWIDGSRRIAFLGKNGSPYQRLFVIDVETGAVRAVTKDQLYVTAYDVRDDTLAYTVLAQPKRSVDFERDLIEVGQRNVFELLYRDLPSIEDLNDGFVRRYPNSLHIQKNGEDLAFDFTMQGMPLQMFNPMLSLSPDGTSLIALAAVREVPKEWEQYQAFMEFFQLKSGPVPERSLMTIESWWRPEEYVVVNLKTGVVHPIIDAPAARNMGYGHVPTRVFWLEDERHAILTNTYLPLSTAQDDKSRLRRTKRPVVTVLDLSTGDIRANVDLTDAPSTKQSYHIKDIEWDRIRRKLTVTYRGSADVASPSPDIYVLRSGEWVKSHEGPSGEAHSAEEPMVEVRQDLNHPPALWALNHGSNAVRVWEPNPELENLSLGNASIYHWRDTSGKARSGILVLPPDYDAKRRYPLVIQTHGYETDKFFADGMFSTGSGGRALVAKNVIVLQMSENRSHFSSPHEAPDNLVGFESAITQLAADGLVDRNRIGIIGFSRTVFSVLYALTHRPGLFRAATITDGINFGYVAYMLDAHPEYQKEAEEVNGGAPFGDGLAKWAQNSPNFNLDKVVAPLLMSVYLKAELLYEWETYSALRKLNKPVELLWWWKGNVPHVLVQPAQRFASQQSAVDWFDFWLNDREDPDAAKADQYARWRELRTLQHQSETASGWKP